MPEFFASQIQPADIAGSTARGIRTGAELGQSIQEGQSRQALSKYGQSAMAGDPGALSEIWKKDPPLAMKVMQFRTTASAAQMDAAIKNFDYYGRVFQGLKALPDDQIVHGYELLRQKAQADGLDHSELPDTQDPNAIRAVADRRIAMGMSIKEHLSQQNSDRTYDLAKLKIGADLGNKATDNARAAETLSETKRHNLVTEAKTGARPMPATLQKSEDEDLDAINTAQAIKADIGAQRQKIESGAFKVDRLNTAGYDAAAAVGQGGPETANYQSFKATLEKMRNDSLRLNKGVQTEGDAQRAWNEMFSALGKGDQATVTRRLQEIENINSRAVDLKKRIVDNRRARNKAEPFDWGTMQEPGTAVEPSAAPTAAPASSGGWTVRKVK